MWILIQLVDLVSEGASALLDALERLVVRLVNPRAHAWIAANARAVELHEQGLLDRARPEYEQALRLARGSRRSLRIAITLVNMALLAMREGRLEDAELHLAEALAIRSRELGPDSRVTRSTRGWLATVHLEADHPAKAAEVFAVGLQQARERHGADSGEAAEAALPLAYAQERAGDLAEAEAHYRSAAATAERLAGPVRPVTARYLLALGAFLARHERWADAEPVLARARDIWGMTGDERSLTPAVEHLITVYRMSEQREAAVAAAERYARNVSRFHDRDPAAVAAALERQVETLRWADAARKDEADRLARRAAIMRAAAERREREDSESDERRRQVMQPVVQPVVTSMAEVLASTKPQKD